jgi:hypothetical protein
MQHLQQLLLCVDDWLCFAHVDRSRAVAGAVRSAAGGDHRGRRQTQQVSTVMTEWLVWRSCPGPIWLYPLVVTGIHTLQYRCSACLTQSLVYAHANQPEHSWRQGAVRNNPP